MDDFRLGFAAEIVRSPRGWQMAVCLLSTLCSLNQRADQRAFARQFSFFLCGPEITIHPWRCITPHED
jgi:hypothetical protein